MRFEIGAANNSANLKLLESFRDFFGGGNIYLIGNQLYYKVTDLQTLLKVRDHFNNYFLQSTKLIYFKLWSQVLDLMVAKEHLTEKGLFKIVALKSLFPMGLNDSLIKAFSSFPLIKRPEFISSTDSLDPNWIAGFANGDGFFSLGYIKDSRHRLGATCKPLWRITQHERDKILLERLITFLDYGSIIPPSSNRNT